MKRRGFLAALAALPSVRRWFREDDSVTVRQRHYGYFVAPRPGIWPVYHWIDSDGRRWQRNGDLGAPPIEIRGLSAWMPDENTPLTKSVDRTFRA